MTNYDPIKHTWGEAADLARVAEDPPNAKAWMDAVTDLVRMVLEAEAYEIARFYDTDALANGAGAGHVDEIDHEASACEGPETCTHPAHVDARWTVPYGAGPDVFVERSGATWDAQ